MDFKAPVFFRKAWACLADMGDERVRMNWNDLGQAAAGQDEIETMRLQGKSGMNVRMKTLALTSAAMLLGMTASAYATNIDITNVQVPYGLYGVVLTGGDLPGSSPYSVYLTGEIVLTTQYGALATWCVDLFHDIELGGSYVYMTIPLTTDNDGSTPSNSAPLTTQQIDDISYLATIGTAEMNANPSNDLSAAIQAAIWQVEYATTASYSGDTGFATDLAAIDAMLANNPPSSYDGGVEVGNTGDQGLFNNQHLFTTQTVPEPSTWAMMLIGFAGLGFAGYRSAKAKTAVA